MPDREARDTAPLFEREAHLETVGSGTSSDRRRVASQPDYRRDAEQPLMPGISNYDLLSRLAEAAEKYNIGADALAGFPNAPTALGEALAALGRAGELGKGGGGRGRGEGGRGGGGYGFGAGDFERLLGPGRGKGGPGGASSKRPDIGGGAGWGGTPQGGDAMDPKSPSGRPFGDRGGRTGGGLGDGSGDLERYGQAAWEGLEQGLSAGRGGPSRAERSGNLWKAIHPGRDVSEDPKKPPDGGTDGGTPDGGGGGGRTPGAPGSPSAPGAPNAPAMPPAGPSSMTPPVVNSGGLTTAEVRMGVGVGTVGAVVGGLIALLVSKNELWMVGGGAVGFAVGAAAGYSIAHHFKWMPADDGHGGGSGPTGPGALVSSSAARNAVRSFMPAPDDSGPGTPRSVSAAFAADRAQDARGRSLAGRFMPAPDDAGPGTPRSAEAADRTRAGRADLYKPQPDDIGPGGPRG